MATTQTTVTFIASDPTGRFTLTGTTVVQAAAAEIASIAYTITTAPDATIVYTHASLEPFSQSVVTKSDSNLGDGYVKFTAHVTLTYGSATVNVTCTPPPPNPPDQPTQTQGTTGVDVTPDSAYMHGA